MTVQPTSHTVTVEAIRQAREILAAALGRVGDVEAETRVDCTDDRVRLGRILETLNANDPATLSDQLAGLVWNEE